MGDHKVYYILINGFTIISSNNFDESVKLLMASFFIFNLSYPKECSNTLEFIERYMLKIHSVTTRGTQKRVGGMPRKVSSLLTALAEI